MSKINQLEVYASAGEIAGRAIKNKDCRLASFQNSWLSKALAIEQPEYRNEARAAYNAAYRNASGVLVAPSEVH